MKLLRISTSCTFILLLVLGALPANATETDDRLLAIGKELPFISLGEFLANREPRDYSGADKVTDAWKILQRLTATGCRSMATNRPTVIHPARGRLHARRRRERSGFSGSGKGAALTNEGRRPGRRVPPAANGTSPENSEAAREKAPAPSRDSRPPPENSPESALPSGDFSDGAGESSDGGLEPWEKSAESSRDSPESSRKSPEFSHESREFREIPGPDPAAGRLFLPDYQPFATIGACFGPRQGNLPRQRGG